MTFVMEQSTQVMANPPYNHGLVSRDCCCSPSSHTLRLAGLGGNFPAFRTSQKNSKFRAPGIVPIPLSKCFWILAQIIRTMCSKRRRILWRNVNAVGNWTPPSCFADLRASLKEQPLLSKADQFTETFLGKETRPFNEKWERRHP